MGLLCSRSDTPKGGLRSQSLALKAPTQQRFPRLLARRSRLQVHTKQPPQKTNNHPFGWFLFLVRQMGLEPIRSRTRPSNVPVCQFQHCRAPCKYSRRRVDCQSVLIKFLSSFFTGFFCSPMVRKKPSTYAENRDLPHPKHSFFQKTKHGVLFSHVYSRYNIENRLR